MIKKMVVCDRCHEAEAKYYTGKLDDVYCEKCIMEVLNARVVCFKCERCGRKIQNPEHIAGPNYHYCSVECLIKGVYGTGSEGGELNDTQKEFLIANG